MQYFKNEIDLNDKIIIYKAIEFITSIVVKVMLKMMYYLILLVIASTTFAAEMPAVTLKDLYSSTISLDNRIVDGTPATTGQFPYQVSVNFQTNSGTFFCGGALISDTWVLTAAHCAEGAVFFTIGLGAITLNAAEPGRVTVTTTTAVVHPNYNNWLNNDVALIRLNSPVAFSDTIQPIRLPSRNNKVEDEVIVRVSGWGKISDSATGVSNTLNWVDLTTISNQRCAAVYGTGTVISSTLCAVGNPHHSTCNGDSGGPLVTYDSNGVPTHQAVVSFVHTNGCGSGNPSGYVRTEAMLDWIAEVTGLDV